MFIGALPFQCFVSVSSMAVERHPSLQTRAEASPVAVIAVLRNSGKNSPNDDNNEFYWKKRLTFDGDAKSKYGNKPCNHSSAMAKAEARR